MKKKWLIDEDKLKEKFRHLFDPPIKESWNLNGNIKIVRGRKRPEIKVVEKIIEECRVFFAEDDNEELRRLQILMQRDFEDYENKI